jgi:hypothetical protein
MKMEHEVFQASTVLYQDIKQDDRYPQGFMFLAKDLYHPGLASGEDKKILGKHYAILVELQRSCWELGHCFR